LKWDGAFLEDTDKRRDSTFQEVITDRLSEQPKLTFREVMRQLEDPKNASLRERFADQAKIDPKTKEAFETFNRVAGEAAVRFSEQFQALSQEVSLKLVKPVLNLVEQVRLNPETAEKINEMFRALARVNSQFATRGKLFEEQLKATNSIKLNGLNQQPERLQELLKVVQGISTQPRLAEVLKTAALNESTYQKIAIASARSTVELSQFVLNNYKLSPVEGSFVAQLADVVEQIPQEGSEISDEELQTWFNSVFEFLIRWLGKVGDGYHAHEGKLAILIGFACTVYTVLDSRQMEARLTADNRELREEFHKKFAQMTPAEEPETLYVVLRMAKLVESPKPKACIVAILPPHQQVKLLQSKGAWIEVEYQDYIAGYMKRGWVLKKYLKLVTTK
jgi:hypothetical protein